jgi:hypothetical protein
MASPPLGDDQVAHQTVHGYQHGHELLRATLVLEDEAASVLSRNSDSAPNARASDGPYLTGYPLPDGRYVVARTWPDADAERPNTVITQSLILPVGSAGQLSADAILHSLSKMPTAERAIEPIPMKELAGRPIALAFPEAAVASMYYLTPGALAFADSGGRDRIALGIWSQLWRSARYRLRFCTAPDARRFRSSGRSIQFESLPREVAALSPSPAAQVLRDDLVHPGPFREFIHLVGAGEISIALMEPFAEAYLLLHARPASVDAFGVWLRRNRASDPKRLRRLKRRFLGFTEDTPRWRADPTQVVESLAQRDLGESIFASDASLDLWVRLSWETDAQRTADLLHRPNLGDSDEQRHPQTAAEGLAEAFTTQASQLITASTLPLAMQFDSRAASAAVWERNEPALWRAYAVLEQPSNAGPTDPSEPYRWNVPVEALRTDTRAVADFVRRYPQSLDALITLANSTPAPNDGQVELTGDAKRYIRNRLEHSDPELVGLSRVSFHGTLPRRLDISSWVPLLAGRPDEAVQATAYLIAREAPGDHWEVATLAVSCLYEDLAKAPSTRAWDRLGPHLRGDKGSWDRCQRLVVDFAALVRRYTDDEKRGAVGLLRKRSSRASAALEKVLSSPGSKRFKLLDPSTWL